MQVRAFYLDIQEWALRDPYLGRAGGPQPGPPRRHRRATPRHERQVTAAMHQRVRERLPQLPTSSPTPPHRHRIAATELLAAAAHGRSGEEFDHDGVRYRRIAATSWPAARTRTGATSSLVEDARHRRDDQPDPRARTTRSGRGRSSKPCATPGSGSRNCWRSPTSRWSPTGCPTPAKSCPLLQIVPSKTNQERLLLVSPELASVLATIISRLRRDNGGTVPLTARYDPHERLTRPPLPHLFQRRTGHRNEVISVTTVQNLLDAAIARAGLLDLAGAPLRFTPHDFRRIFATEAVTGGLPVHIAARLLGHQHLATTQAYLAVFQDDLIRTYRAFLDQRRSRPPAGRIPRTHRRRVARVPPALRPAQGRTRHLRPPLRHPLQTRTRLHPLPDAARRPRATPPTRRDHPQPHRPDRRGPTQRLARRGRKACRSTSAQPTTRSPPWTASAATRHPHRARHPAAPPAHQDGANDVIISVAVVQKKLFFPAAEAGPVRAAQVAAAKAVCARLPGARGVSDRGAGRDAVRDRGRADRTGATPAHQPQHEQAGEGGSAEAVGGRPTEARG